jgi:exodeoxyribonuclease VII large subunit
MELDGVGALYEAYEKLKQKLDGEGLFDAKYKKKIPYMPKEIGVVTSKTGAVIRDIINVTTRRLPNVHIKLYPASVQGKGAAETIVRAIKYFNEAKNVDVIIVARGGGSLEDLWPFNEEITARAIFESEIPIISAVGHETDFTIADFVADLRAPTPSAAGELAVPDINDVKWKLNNIKRALGVGLKKKLELSKNYYKKIIDRRIFKEPTVILRDKILTVNNYEKDLRNCAKILLKDSGAKLSKLTATLDSLSPLKTLSRGFLVLEDENKNVITSAQDLNTGEVVKLMMHDGEKNAQIL